MAGPNIVGPRCNVLVVDTDTSEPLARYDNYLAVDPQNPFNMVGICRRFYGNGVNYQDQLAAQYTFDGGLSWSEELLSIDTSVYYSISDPWIGIVIDKGGNSIVYVIALGVTSPSGQTTGSAAAAENIGGTSVLCYTSSDNGQTWSQPATIVTASFCDNTFGAVDINNHRVYAIWNDSEAGAGTLAFAWSQDGVTWNASASAVTQNTAFDLPVPGGLFNVSGFNFVNMSVGSDGTIHIIGANSAAPTTMSYARSENLGETFEFGSIATGQQGVGDIQSVYQAAANYFNGGVIVAVVNPPTICAALNGFVFAAWSVDTGNRNPPIMRIAVASCTDNGDTWIENATNPAPPPAVPLLPLGALSQTPQDNYIRPRLAVAPGEINGVVGCAFTYCQMIGSGSSVSANLSTCLAVTGAALQVISGPIRGVIPLPYFDPRSTTVVTVSDQATDLIPAIEPIFRWGIDGQFQANFIGDFIGLTANSFGFFPFWSDTRTGAAQPVFTRVAVAPCTTYIRHFLSDDGDLSQPGPGESMFDAPDLIVRLQPDGDTTFVDQPIPTNPQDLYVYGRVFNSGPAPASNPTLTVVMGFYLPGTEWFHPYDWYAADWGPYGISAATHTNLGSAPPLGATIAPGSSAILGPITIPQAEFPFGLYGHPCLLAMIHVDNDDGYGTPPEGCALYAEQGPGGMESFFWQTNKTCQKNLTQLILPPGQLIELPFVIGHPYSLSQTITLVLETSGIFLEHPLQLRRLANIPTRPGARPLPAPRSLGGWRPPIVSSINEEWSIKDATSRVIVDRRNEPTVPMAVALQISETAHTGETGRIRIIQYNDNGLMAGAVDYSVVVGKA